MYNVYIYLYSSEASDCRANVSPDHAEDNSVALRLHASLETLNVK